MRILADENIPHVRHFFEPFGEVVTAPGGRSAVMMRGMPMCCWCAR